MGSGRAEGERRVVHVRLVLYSAAECVSQVAICPSSVPEREVRR